jgi:hypothetical protein
MYCRSGGDGFKATAVASLWEGKHEMFCLPCLRPDQEGQFPAVQVFATYYELATHWAFVEGAYVTL